MTKHILLTLVLLTLLFTMTTCDDFPNVPKAITPSPDISNPRQQSATAANAPTTSDLTLTPSPTPIPLPTPTPVPLPKACLQTEFVNDVENCGAIPYYEISLSVNPATAQVTGHQEIRYTNLEDKHLDEIYLRLFPNTPSFGGRMTVTQPLLAGWPVTPITEFEGSALRLPVDPPLDVGQSITLSMDFTVDVPTTDQIGHALFAYVRGVMALPTIYPLIPVYDNEKWNIEIAPEHSDDTYTDIAAYQVQVTAPTTMTLVASGACSQQAEDTVTTWFCEAAPMRDFVLILGENFALANRVSMNVVVNSYFYRGHRRGGDKALTVATDALTIFNELFGPYPYAELDIVETPNNLGGMEYPSLVVIEDALYPGITGMEWLVAHEVAHQWWFGVVGSDQIDEPWLDEALTQYSTLLYYEKVYGENKAADLLHERFVHTHESLIRKGRDMPAGLPARAYSPEFYWQIVYDKGALYFYELRQIVGDDAFFEILKTYYNRHRYGIATPNSFLAVVEDVTGDRYRDLFERWIAEDGD